MTGGGRKRQGDAGRDREREVKTRRGRLRQGEGGKTGRGRKRQGGGGEDREREEKTGRGRQRQGGAGRYMDR